MSSPGRRPPAPPPAEPRPAADPAQAPGDSAGAPKESRSELRAAAVRANLEPLDGRELPRPLAAAIAIAGVLGLVNLGGFALRATINGHRLGPGVLSFSLVMGLAAWGMWRRRYWAVLGFQAFLALLVLYFCLLLILVSNLAALLLCLAVIGLGSWLFWKLVRVLARIQTPPPAE